MYRVLTYIMIMLLAGLLALAVSARHQASDNYSNQEISATATKLAIDLEIDKQFALTAISGMKEEQQINNVKNIAKTTFVTFFYFILLVVIPLLFAYWLWAHVRAKHRRKTETVTVKGIPVSKASVVNREGDMIRLIEKSIELDAHVSFSDHANRVQAVPHTLNYQPTTSGVTGYDASLLMRAAPKLTDLELPSEPNPLAKQIVLSFHSEGPRFRTYRIERIPDTNGNVIPYSVLETRKEDVAMMIGAKTCNLTHDGSHIYCEVSEETGTAVPLLEIFNSPEYKSDLGRLKVVIGKGKSNRILLSDVSTWPHGLVGGATRQGKSVFLRTLIASLMFNKGMPVNIVIIDLKRVSFPSAGNHKFVVSISKTPSSAEVIASKCVRSMHERYKLMEKNNIDDYYRLDASEDGYKPPLVIIIDEASHVFSECDKDFRKNIKSISALGGAAGIHLILADQKGSKNQIPTEIKINLGFRACFFVPSEVDSRVVLGVSGAEELKGAGDMMYTSGGAITRCQGAFCTRQDFHTISTG